MVVLFSGLGAFFLVEVVKSLWPRKLEIKLAWTALAAFGMTLMLAYGHPWRILAGWALGAAGLAIVLHRFSRALWRLGDWLTKVIMRMR